MSGAIFQVTDRDGLCAFLREANQARKPFWVVDQGDAHADSAATRLDLSALDRVLFFDPDDLVVGVEVGQSMAALQALLAEKGMGLPVSSWFADETVGALVAKNRFGAERLFRGGVRDAVIGMTYATVDGRLIEVGGRVVKNVTGYDLSRLMVGNRGELAVLVSVNFKLSPLPKNPQTLVYQVDDWAAATTALVRARIPLDACQVRLDDGAAQIAVALTGSDARRADLRAQVTQICGDCLTSANEAAPTRLLTGPLFDDHRRLHGAHVYGRLATSALAALWGDLRTAPPSVGALLHPIGADLHLWGEETQLQALLKPRAGDGGTWVWEAAKAETTAQGAVFPPPKDLSLQAKIKKQFDPNRLLPNRFHGGA